MNINGIYIVSNMVVQIDDTGIGMEWSLFNDICPAGHISRPTHFCVFSANSFVIFNSVVIWILWLMRFNVCNLIFIDSSYQVKECSPPAQYWSFVRGSVDSPHRGTIIQPCHDSYTMYIVLPRGDVGTNLFYFKNVFFCSIWQSYLFYQMAANKSFFISYI